jgi:hypothetical protein
MALKYLRGTGTCLSRALVVAARTPHACVVIGADPRRSARFAAHAWVEVQGTRLPDDEPPANYEELARIDNR